MLYSLINLSLERQVDRLEEITKNVNNLIILE